MTDKTGGHNAGDDSQCPWETVALLKFRQHDSLLRLVFAFAVGVANFADFVGLEEEDLAQAFVGVDAGRKRRRVRDFQGAEASPLGLEWGEVDDNAQSSVGAVAITVG